MDPAQTMATGACSTPSELWRKINENNEGSENDLRNNALADFLGLTYRKGESVTQYCGRYETALNRLITTGQPVDESMKLWVFRDTLPKHLKQTVKYWSMANRNGTVPELISSLKIQHHLDKNERNSDSFALFTSEDRQRRPYKNGNETSFSQHQNNKRSDQIICNYCKKPGHRWKECRKKKYDDERKKKFSSQRNDQSKPRENSKEEKKELVNSDAFIVKQSKHTSFTTGKYSWIVDSGATSHMTSNRKWFDEFEAFDEPEPIVIGNGKQIAAYGQGKINFSSAGFSGWLESVLWVPKLTENLFSVNQALVQGCQVNFGMHEVGFLKGGKLTLRGEKNSQGVFELKLRPTRSQMETAMIGVPLKEWHQRFSHSSVTSVQELIRKGALVGLSVDESKKTDRCKSCVLGKITRCPHPLTQKITASETAAVLDIDTAGAMPESLGKSKYYVLAIEEYSDYKFIEFVARKTEIPRIVKRLITKTSLETKRQVKMILTDNGT